MKILVLLLCLLGSSLSYAVEMAPDLSQSSPSINWYSIQNQSVKLIYPDYLQAESVYIANLVEHYSKFVGQTYKFKDPQLFTLIIRPEMAQPNGFVTLMPRRSEWFSSSMFSPGVGSTEWYQTLAIHEYRHVNQFDHFKQRTTKALYYIMGDLGVQLAAGITLPSWYFEGDAVWAETKYTDGGRGRSPRFMARLKALVLSDKIPTYDEFLSGTYQTNLPNQYVYGYALVSYATQKFGENVWRDITTQVSKVPIPLRLYRAFRTVTKQDFGEFYAEAMNDLRTKWASDAMSEKIVDFREHSVPVKNGDTLYYIKQTLDSYPTLMKEQNGKSEEIAELSYSRELMVFDLGKTKAVYTAFLPDTRYSHKGSSELIVLDLASGKKTQLTQGQRLYNPRMNKSETKIVVTDFTPKQLWNITEYDLSGKVLRTFNLPDHKVAEATYLDDNTLMVLVENKIGQKSIVTVDLATQKIVKEILPPSRNLLHSLFVDSNNHLFFEGQYKGQNEIFKFDGSTIAQCTKSKLGAYTPFSDGVNLYYSNQDLSGSAIAQAPLASCVSLPATELVNFNYLGKTPSDNYNNFVPQPFPEQEGLFTANANKYQPEEYGDFDSRLFIPHTWGLNLGRGGGVGFQSDNYLRTLGFSGVLGTSAEELQTFAELNFDIKKYYPLLRVQTNYYNRKVSDFVTGSTLEWQETSAGLGTLIPYIKRSGLYNFTAITTLSANFTDTRAYKFNKNDITTTGQFLKTYASLGFEWDKDMKARSIISPWLLGYKIRYDDADDTKNTGLTNYRVLQQAALQTPALFDNDGFAFTYNEQKQGDRSFGDYSFIPEGTALSYVFSRGYSYEDVTEFKKKSIEYVFPVAYPDWNLGGWYYLKRIYSKAFFDSTEIEDVQMMATLDSFGMELYFESTILRFLPMSFGARVLQRSSDSELKGEVFLATAVGF